LTERFAGKRREWEKEEGEKKENPSPSILFFYNGFHRTYLRTASAFRAFLFIDDVRFTFLDGFCGTFL
jgi:hypothetical protein